MQSVQKEDESIDPIVSGCSKLTQKEYKRRHDNPGKNVHWKLARKCNFEARDKWYEHEPEVFQRMKIIKSYGISVFILTMLSKLGDQIWLSLIRKREVVK